MGFNAFYITTQGVFVRENEKKKNVLMDFGRRAYIGRYIIYEAIHKMILFVFDHIKNGPHVITFIG